MAMAHAETLDAVVAVQVAAGLGLAPAPLAVRGDLTQSVAVTVGPSDE
jgi:hypothetical protein